ncbi:alpha/beta-hydrolase [Pleurotus eryngii]|uniref:Alpha/beta-hydrolase n=1 Tax=Pleurotus eryngii TaxID=5323 RepID=A0A9P6AAB4_PLEER|nr:alpha/beta-hydrolase [Pleurotus eryngii]
MSNANVEVKTFVLEGPVAQGHSEATFPPLKMVANRYRWNPSSSQSKVANYLSGVSNRGTDNLPSDDYKSGLTLLFAHGVGAHKEQWEPTILSVFQRSSLSGVAKARLREAWAFDWQNHGDAAVLNRDALQRRPSPGVSVYEWAKAMSAFMKSDHMKGHKIIPIGHSGGAGAVMLTLKDFPLWAPPHVAFVLVEPTIMSEAQWQVLIDDRMEKMQSSIRMTMKRRTLWPNREDAFAWFRRKYPGTTWDDRVLRAFVDHGMEETPEGIRLKCEKDQEASSYSDVEGHFEASKIVTAVCHTIPIHYIWAKDPTYLPLDVRASLSDASYGRKARSIKLIEGAGHMVVQEKPDLVAKAICDVLADTSMTTTSHIQARL